MSNWGQRQDSRIGSTWLRFVQVIQSPTKMLFLGCVNLPSLQEGESRNLGAVPVHFRICKTDIFLVDLPIKKPQGGNGALPPPHNGRGPSDGVRDDSWRALLATQ